MTGASATGLFSTGCTVVRSGCPTASPRHQTRMSLSPTGSCVNRSGGAVGGKQLLAIGNDFMIQMDERLDTARLAQFAAQSTEIKVKIRLFLEEGFVGDQSQEFYIGLASAFAVAYQVTTLPNAHEHIGNILAIASEHALKAKP
jgi:hypothetical protein